MPLLPKEIYVLMQLHAFLSFLAYCIDLMRPLYLYDANLSVSIAD